MTIKKMLVTLPLNEEQKEWLEEAAKAGEMPVKIVYKPTAEVEEEDVRDVDAVFGNVSPAILRSAERLQWLQLNSAGANPYADKGVLDEKVLLTTAVGAYGLTVSEHMLAMTFALIRKFDLYAKKQEKRDWSDCGAVTSIEGSTIAVFGMGNIGNDYARKVKALGAYVIGVRKHDRQKPEFYDEQYTYEQIDEVIPEADIIAMVLPGAEDTKNIMNAERIGLMKKGAYLINVGRGMSVDESALISALKEDRIAGAAIDVAKEEPLPEESPLWKAGETERLIITPHVAGQFFLPETLNRITKIGAENLRAALTGGKMRNVVKR